MGWVSRVLGGSGEGDSHSGIVVRLRVQLCAAYSSRDIIEDLEFSGMCMFPA